MTESAREEEEESTRARAGFGKAAIIGSQVKSLPLPVRGRMFPRKGNNRKANHCNS